MARKLRWPLFAAAAAVLVLTTTTALAGSGVGDVFNLGVTNSVDATSTLSGSVSGPQLKVVNNGTGTGLRAQSSDSAAAGVLGSHTSTGGSGAGVEGDTSSTDANAHGVTGKIVSTTPSNTSAAVYGLNNGGIHTHGFGVLGEHKGDGIGVEGKSNYEGVAGYGGLFGGDFEATTLDPDAIGVRGIGPTGILGYASDSTPNAIGVVGCAWQCTVNPVYPAGGWFGAIGAGSDGIRVDDPSTSGRGAEITSGNVGLTVSGPNDGIQTSATAAGKSGIWAHHDGTKAGYGIYAQAPVLAGSFAGYFKGNVGISGTLTKGAGSFKIDDPLDPAHKYLQHSFVESPDMKNVYDGIVVTDGRGFAVVRLPRYFQALNRTFRYQLTIVGHSFAQAIVWREIHQNRFTIRTNRPRVKVSWQVTGVRHDAYANAHRIPVETEKPSSEQGTYLHPGLFRRG